MKLKREKNGFTLADIMLSVTILIIAVCGSIQYMDYLSLEMRKSKMQIGGAELAQLLAETWRGKNGSGSFDAAGQFNSAVALSSTTAPAKPSDHDLLGSYALQWNGYDYKTTLSSKNMPNGLKALNVVVSWPFGNSGSDKEFRVTTYTD